jgi:hypothetical protein
MALSNIEGCTIGGLDEGRGHNARILGFAGTVLLGTNITGTCVHSVTKDGTVTNTNSGSATHALTLEYGNGLTLEVPALTDDDEALFKLTFGDVSTTTVTANTEQLNIQFAMVDIGIEDESLTGDDFNAIPACVKSVSGNQIVFALGEYTINGADIEIVATDILYIRVMAFALPSSS